MFFKTSENRSYYLIFFLGLLFFFSPLSAQDEKDPKYLDKKLALLKAAQDPLDNMYSVPLQHNFNFGYGNNKEMQYILNIEPIIPFSLPGNWLFINRSILSVISQPIPKKKFGLGDLITSFYFVPPRLKHFGCALGPIFQFPTATDEILGSEKLSIGPTAAFIYTKGHFLFGTLYYNLSSVAGRKSRKHVNVMTLQPFYYYNLPNEWYIVSAPIIKANWRETKNNVWLVPLGGGFGKLLDCNNQFINLNLAVYYNIKRPQFREKWTFRFVTEYLFPK
ncbi:MAG: hypothetical protein WC688_04680 [Parachlamydiales bacterium]|jgi:hypothetical protein